MAVPTRRVLALQLTHTLLFTNILLPATRTHLPGFATMERQLGDWLRSR